MSLGAFLLAWVGFTALSLAMLRHRQMWRPARSRGVQIALRSAGSLALAVALGLCVATAGWSIGLVLWTGLLTTAALLTVAQIAFARK
jgi:hypothetical protein